MTAGSVDRALASCQAWLAAQDAPEAAIAVSEAGIGSGAAEAHRWVNRILNGQAASGAWDGDLLATAHALLTIQELRSGGGLVEQDPGIGRALEWIRGARRRPGSWADGCRPARHDAGLCHHFIGGLFSPGPPDPPLDEARLRCGARAVGDGEVRFVASATALRCLIAWSPPGPDARLHLDALRRVVNAWDAGPPEGLSTASLLAAVHALAASADEADRAVADRGLRLVASRQRGDGSWVDTDAFQALDVIGAAADAGVAPDRAQRALWHAARLLIASQQADGSWGREYGPRRALIAWRTFRRLVPEV